jgi:hypothetical protein
MEAEANPDALKILAGDLIEEGGIGNLASPEVQAELDTALAETDLLILDNLSSLTAVIRDNDAESWGPIQEWLLKLRRRGMSVLIVHHAPVRAASSAAQVGERTCSIPRSACAAQRITRPLKGPDLRFIWKRGAECMAMPPSHSRLS